MEVISVLRIVAYMFYETLWGYMIIQYISKHLS